MAHFARINLNRFAVRAFRFRQIFRLRVRIAQQIEQRRRRSFAGHALQQRHRVGGLSLVEQQLRQLLHARFVVRVTFQNSAEHSLRLLVPILQSVKPRQP